MPNCIYKWEEEIHTEREREERARRRGVDGQGEGHHGQAKDGSFMAFDLRAVTGIYLAHLPHRRRTHPAKNPAAAPLAFITSGENPANPHGFNAQARSSSAPLKTHYKAPICPPINVVNRSHLHCRFLQICKIKVVRSSILASVPTVICNYLKQGVKDQFLAKIPAACDIKMDFPACLNTNCNSVD
ncbi:hypothetical protein ACLOJK_031722 [Asimina triloba]